MATEECTLRLRYIMSPEIQHILQEFGEEHGWFFSLDASSFAANSFKFCKTYRSYNKGYKKPYKAQAEAILEINWHDGQPTVLCIRHPYFTMILNGFKFENRCSFESGDPKEVDLIHPNSLDGLQLLFVRADDESEEFMRQTIWRHKKGIENDRKSRKRSRGKGRRDR